MKLKSWGQYPVTIQEQVLVPAWRTDPFPLLSESLSVLPFAWGRSYGDSCLNDRNVLLHTKLLDRWISFDSKSGRLVCEAGLSLEQILAVVVPQGWFLPVTPGTQFISIGGAIANDVHGKNHHCAGTFGHYVSQFELLRSDGNRLLCSKEQNSDWYHATIGGLGLTGLITWAEIQLKPIHNPFIQQEVIRFRNIDEFMQISGESEKDFEYTVSWIDCLASGESLGKGLFIRGNHCPARTDLSRLPSGRPKSVPFYFPNWTMNGFTIRAFNQLYYNKQFKRCTQSVVHYTPFFYPLDAILNWNRIYGKAGFLQYQFVVPFKADQGRAIRRILAMISQAGIGSFLTVLKIFGSIPSSGLMSFPREGITLAIDFPLRASGVFELLKKLDQIVVQAGGAVYPAKDARMSAEVFQASFPHRSEFLKYIDPRFSSSFWRRVNA